MVAPVVRWTVTQVSSVCSKVDQLIVRPAEAANSAPSSESYPSLSLPLRGTDM